MVRVRPFRCESREFPPPNTEGNSKANRLKSAIPKIHSLKEMRALPEDQRKTVADSGHPGEYFAHHRRVLSSLHPTVQHIEHMFSPLYLFYRSRPFDGKFVFNILN
jgi:hypothetical protein